MQTRAQAQSALLAAAAQAVVQPAAPPAPLPNATNNLQRASSSGTWSSLSTLTPTSSFVSEAGTVVTHRNGSNLPSISETEAEDDFNNDAATPGANFAAFGVPRFGNPGGRSLRTPVHSQSDRYPPEVFETPKKNARFPNKPTEYEQRVARWARDSELATRAGMAQLTRNGTLVVVRDDSPESDHRGEGLASGFTLGITPTKTRIIDPDTGEFRDI